MPKLNPNKKEVATKNQNSRAGVYKENVRYVCFTGKEIPKELYDKILKLDAEVFSIDANEYDCDTTMPKEVLRGFLKKNILTTTIIYDQLQKRVVGYAQAFPLRQEFLDDYATGKAIFKDLTSEQVETYEDGKPKSLYFWSIGLIDELRGKKLSDTKASELDGKSPFKLLIENFAWSIVDVKKEGYSISKIYSEGVSEKGIKFSKTICGEKNLLHENKEENCALYGGEFNFKNLVKGLDREIKDKLIAAYNSAQNERA